MIPVKDVAKQGPLSPDFAADVMDEFTQPNIENSGLKFVNLPTYESNTEEELAYIPTQEELITLVPSNQGFQNQLAHNQNTFESEHRLVNNGTEPIHMSEEEVNFMITELDLEMQKHLMTKYNDEEYRSNTSVGNVARLASTVNVSVNMS